MKWLDEIKELGAAFKELDEFWNKINSCRSKML